MKTPNDPTQENQYSLGKKVVPREVITPDWTHRPDLGPHIWQHKDGKLKNARPLTASEIWAEAIRKQLEHIGWDS